MIPKARLMALIRPELEAQVAPTKLPAVFNMALDNEGNLCIFVTPNQKEQS